MAGRVNRFVAAMPPGSSEARRSYCTCPRQGNGYLAEKEPPDYFVQELDGTAYVINRECPLHSPSPEHELPSSI